MRLANEDLEKFGEWKNALCDMLASAKNVFSNLSMPLQESSASGMLTKVKSETFKVMVVGEFKVGKSTFINALLGAEILPSFAVPCTAVINEVKYGDDKKAVLYFKKEIHALPEKLPQASRAHILKYNSKNVPPLEIPVAQLEEFVVIAEPEKDQKESVAETPYERAVLYWPLALCRDNVEVIDSPGLNENSTRTAIAASYMPSADAVLFVINSQAALSVTEMDFIDQNIRRAGGHEYVFFIFNRFHQVMEKDRKRLMDYCIAKLAGKTKDSRFIFFVDAYDALQGKMTGDFRRVKESGFSAFESMLSSFLAGKKGRVKLLGPAKKLQKDISTAMQVAIPDLNKMLDTDLTVFEKKLKEIEPQLAVLETKKNQLRRSIKNRIDSFRLELEKDCRENIYQIVNETPGWLSAATVKTKFNPFQAKTSAKNILDELIGIYQDRVEGHQDQWCDSFLTPLISRTVESIKEEFSLGLSDFYLSLDKIRNNITGGIDTGKLSGQKEVSLPERVAAALAGILLLGPGAGAVGAGFGFGKHFFRQIAYQVTAILTLALLGLANPLTMIPVALAIAAFSFFGNMDRVTRKMKTDLSDKIIADLQQRTGDIAAEQAANIAMQLEEESGKVELILDKEIKAIKMQTETILAAKKEGTQKIQARKKELEAYAAQLKLMHAQLSDFITMLESY